MEPILEVVMYHYVRDLPNTKYPAIKGMLASDFRDQVNALAGAFEMATAESALAFLRGEYKPSRDLCLLTFDDGLKEHLTEVTPVLAERKIQGVFSLITGCIEDQVVAPVHMNHFLMASLPFDEYRAEFLLEMTSMDPGAGAEAASVDPVQAAKTYPWDTPEVAQFKLFFNFKAADKDRDAVIRRMFVRHIGAEDAFARELYVSWDESRQMQDSGMVLAGHSHTHRPLAVLKSEELKQDLDRCRTLMDANVKSQPVWPFVYPYGKRNSFDARVIDHLAGLGYDCAFATESRSARPGDGLFSIPRVDCKKVRMPEVEGSRV